MDLERKPVHLVMVTTNNNNKFYDMIPKGDYIEINYGRINATCTTITKPIREWDSIYRSKVKKGYVDKSELICDAAVAIKKPDHEYKPIPEKAVAEIVDRLQAFAKKVIRSNYDVQMNQVTQTMIDEAQELIDRLVTLKDVTTFNQCLLELFAVIPRKMSNVNNYLAHSTDGSEFEKIIDKEQSLLDTLRGQVVVIEMQTEENETEYEHNCTILEAFGIEITPTTEEDVKQIKRELGEDANRYLASWCVTNKKQRKQFDSYIKSHNLRKKDIKLLWHGTRNENVWNILKTGLVLRPTNVVINGKMFGYGIYFAPRARKSIGYTSTYGAGWTKGTAASGFMILHECAYGKAYDVYAFDPKYYDFDAAHLKAVCEDANCLHAHAGSMLRNDEIIFYDESQICAKYLVEIR